MGGVSRVSRSCRGWWMWPVLAVALAGCGSGDTPTSSRAAETTVASSQSPANVEVVDALFLGSGPLIPRDGATDCAIPAVWTSFPRGSAVRVRVSSTVPAEARSAIERAVGQVGGATQGAVTAAVEVTAEADPEPASNEVTLVARPDGRRAGCGSDAGCVLRTFAGRGVLRAARVVAPPTLPASGFVQRAVGSGLLGLCHIDGKRIGGAGRSLMSGGPGVGPGDMAPGLTALDLGAMSAVYASALNPGAPRREFLQAGLVVLQIGERTVWR